MTLVTSSVPIWHTESSHLPPSDPKNAQASTDFKMLWVPVVIWGVPSNISFSIRLQCEKQKHGLMTPLASAVVVPLNVYLLLFTFLCLLKFFFFFTTSVSENNLNISYPLWRAYFLIWCWYRDTLKMKHCLGYWHILHMASRRPWSCKNLHDFWEICQCQIVSQRNSPKAHI